MCHISSTARLRAQAMRPAGTAFQTLRDEQEMQDWFAQQPRGQVGSYQMGDVKARSWVIIGTWSAIFTLKYAAS